MNKFEFMRNLEIYRSNKPKDVLQHDSYDIPKQETHKIQSEYSKAPKVYKDQISLYEEYNDESLYHGGNTKYYQKIDNFYGPGSHRYFYSKEEWDAYNNTKDKEPDYMVDRNTHKMVKNNPDGTTFKTPTTWDQFRNGSIMEDDQKIERTLKESGMSAGIKAMMKDERIQEMLTQFEGGFENHGWDLDENGKVTGLSDDDKKYLKEMSQWMRKFKDSNGDYLFDSKEFQDTLNDEIRKRYDTIKDQKEQESKAQERNKKASSKANSKAAKDPTVKMYVEDSKNKSAKELAKDIYKNRDFGLNELFRETKEAIKDGAMVWDGSDFVPAGDESKYKQAQEYIDEIYRDMSKYITAIANQTGYDSGELWREFRTLTSNKFARLSNKYGKSK